MVLLTLCGDKPGNTRHHRRTQLVVEKPFIASTKEVQLDAKGAFKINFKRMFLISRRKTTCSDSCRLCLPVLQTSSTNVTYARDGCWLSLKS